MSKIFPTLIRLNVNSALACVVVRILQQKKFHLALQLALCSHAIVSGVYLAVIESNSDNLVVLFIIHQCIDTSMLYKCLHCVW